MTATTVRDVLEEYDGDNSMSRDECMEQIRALMPSEQEMMLATAQVWCLPKHSKKQVDPELSKDMVTAIINLIEQRLE